MAVNRDGVNIGTISGGIVNFGGAGSISPITVTKTVSGSSNGNGGSGTSTSSSANSSSNATVNSLIELIRRSLE
jgi:hypothetical protein